MAIQLEMDELEGCKTYFTWLLEQITSQNEKETDHKAPEQLKKESKTSPFGKIFGKSSNKTGRNGADMPSAELKNEKEWAPFSVSLKQLELCRLLYSVDFRSDLAEDETQAVNAMELRRRYAESEGSKVGKSDRDTDRIRKSVHGRCSIFEFFVYLSIRLDDITNEEEVSGSTVRRFFEIILDNSGLSKGSDPAEWRAVIDRFLNREYGSDGSGGGLFPLKTSPNSMQKDQKQVPIWFQMNNWINENLDENGCFLWKNRPEFR